jgi:hypothetical protein
MCFFPIPYLTELTIVLDHVLIPKIFFSCQIIIIGLLSFSAWFYATENHHLIAPKIEKSFICKTRYKALAEPLVSLISIMVALINQSLWDWVWLLLPIPYFLIDIFFAERPV